MSPTGPEVHHGYVPSSLYDYCYLLKFPFPYERGALPATVHNLNRYFNRLERELEMSGKRKTTPASERPNGDGLAWVNYTMTDEEKRDHDAKNVTPEDIGSAIFRVCAQGYNLRVAWDAYSKCFQANLIPFQAENPNFGFAISARGATPFRAVSLLLYKHTEVFEEQWVKFYKTKSASLEG